MKLSGIGRDELERMLRDATAENASLREQVRRRSDAWEYLAHVDVDGGPTFFIPCRMAETVAKQMSPFIHNRFAARASIWFEPVPAVPGTERLDPSHERVGA